MKILMLLSNPYVVDPRVQQEANALLEAGHKVMVIVWDRKKEYPEEEEIRDVKVIRIHNDKIMERLPNDILRNPFWWMKAYKKALEIYKEFKFDVVHSHDLDTLFPAILLKKKLGVKVIFDAHEIFSFMIEGHVPKLVVYFARVMEDLLIPSAEYVITVNEALKEHYSRYGRPECIVRNAKPLIYKEYRPPNNDVFTLVYAGLISKDRFFPEILDIIGNIPNVKLVLVAKKEGLYHVAEEYAKKYKNINFIGTIPHERVYEFIRAADATFVIMDPRNKNNRYGIPNKLFEAMVCGRPIIVTKGTLAAELTERYRCGLTVEYNENSVREAIIKLRDNPNLREELGKNAFKAAKEIFNWENEKKRLLKVYEEVSK